MARPIWQDTVAAGRIEARKAVGRWGSTGDLVGAAIFLASPAAAYVTGACLQVDGGFLSGNPLACQPVRCIAPYRARSSATRATAAFALAVILSQLPAAISALVAIQVPPTARTSGRASQSPRLSIVTPPVGLNPIPVWA